jgi:drug/metabolite transporter (DMT)-like permease
MEIKNRAYTYMLLSLLISSFTPVLLVFTQGANAFEFFFIASLLSIPVGLLLVQRKGKLKELYGLLKERKKLFFIALAALLIYVPFEYAIAYSEHFVSSSLAIVIFRMNPLLMLLFLPVFLRERLSGKQVLALSLAFMGILIGISGGSLNVFANPDLPIIGFLLLMTLGYALANVIFKWQMLDSDLFLTASGFILTIFFGALFLATGAQALPLSGTQISIIIYIAITNIFSFYMYFYAFKTFKTTLVTNVFSVSTFLTFIWSYLVLGTPVEGYYIAMAVLALLGVYVQTQDKIGGSYLTRRVRKGESPTMFDVTGAFADTGEIAIETAIRNGGRVLAMKLDGKHREKVQQVVHEGKHANVFTDTHGDIPQESSFVREIVGAESGDMVVMKAGDTDESERFFEALSGAIENPEPVE